MKPIALKQKFDLIKDYWSPHVAVELNGQEVRLAKLKGEFIWHSHPQQDELFLVIKGSLKVAFRDRMVRLKKHDMLLVPRGVEHKPIAKREVQVLLFEPKETLNTGNKRNSRTLKALKKI